jgi:hypothetical protein
MTATTDRPPAPPAVPRARGRAALLRENHALMAHNARLILDNGRLRAKAAAWDFLADQEPVPGATLADYLDAARVYAYDETGVDLAARREGGA